MKSVIRPPDSIRNVARFLRGILSRDRKSRDREIPITRSEESLISGQVLLEARREIFEDRLRRVSGSGIQRVGGKSARGLSEIEQEGQASSSKA